MSHIGKPIKVHEIIPNVRPSVPVTEQLPKIAIPAVPKELPIEVPNWPVRIPAVVELTTHR